MATQPTADEIHDDLTARLIKDNPRAAAFVAALDKLDSTDSAHCHVELLGTWLEPCEACAKGYGNA